MVPGVHAHLEPWTRLRRKRGRRALWLGVSALGLLAFGIFWVVMGLLIAIRVEDDGPVIGMFCGGVLGVLPLVIGAIVLFLFVRTRMRTYEYEQLMVAARTTGRVSRADAARILRLSLEDAEKRMLELAEHHVLSDDAVSPFAATGAADIHDNPATPAGAAFGALAPGSVLNGTWRIDEAIGAGGMGHVYSVTHTRTGRRYALKMMLSAVGLSEEGVRRFEREARAASALGHAGIATVHDFDRTADGRPFLVMDLLEGETLEQRLRHAGSLRWEDAKPRVLELADALAAAHAAGLIHRDLKPGNVFLHRRDDGAEVAMLLDFGLAKRANDPEASRITATGEAVGTPLYMAPEQARGEALDVRADVYGLAATIYEAVTGVPPFLGATPALAYAQLLHEAVVPASQVAAQPIPPALDELLGRALAKDVDARPASVAELRTALSSC